MSKRISKKLLGAKVTINPIYQNLIQQTNPTSIIENIETYPTTSRASMLDPHTANINNESGLDNICTNTRNAIVDRRTRKRKLVTNESVMVNPKYLKINENSPQNNEQNEIEWLKIRSIEENLQLLKEFDDDTNYQKIHRLICTICGRFILLKDINEAKYSIDCLQPYKSILKNTTGIELKYTSSFSTLNDLILEPLGFNEDITVNICKCCIGYLKSKKLPKYALANNLFVGKIPEELANLTIVEQSLIARCRIKCTIIKLKTNCSIAQTRICGNIITYPQNPDNLLQLLPSLPNAETIQIAFVGKILPIQQTIKKILIVRRQRIEKALLWLKENNTLYEDVIISQESLAQLPENDIPSIIQDNITSIESDETNEDFIAYDDIDRTTDVENDDHLSFTTTGLLNTTEALDLNVLDQIKRIKNEYIKKYSHEISDKYIRVPHNDTPVQEINNPNHLLGSYPCLFPYGIGGLMDVNRKVHLTYREHVNYLLQLGDTRFRNHYSFMFVTFNIIQRQEARNKLNLLIKAKDFNKFSHELSKLTITDFENAERIVKENLNESIHPIIKRLLQKVQSATAKVQGSRAAQRVRRNELRAYSIAFGPPTFYITVNPADIHSPLLLKIGGVDITPEYLTQNIQKRASFLRSNPYLASMYFDIIVTSFITKILKYDDVTKQEGLLGYVKAYYGVIEAQNRGSLHIHMLLWIEGSLKPNELKEKLNDSSFVKSLTSYLYSIIHCDFDGLVNINNTLEIYPCCKPIDYLEKQDITNSFLQDVYQVASITAIHKCTFSCFKTNTKDCRFGYGKFNQGKELVDSTTINKDTGQIMFKRSHKLVNEFNWLMTAALRCNHDIKFLCRSANSSLSVLYYLTNYISKTGLSSYNAILYAKMAFERTKKYETSKEAHLENSIKLLNSIYNTAANYTEYSSQQVASMLQKNGKDGTYYSSHETENLNMYPILLYIDSKQNNSEFNDKLVGINVTNVDLEKTLNQIIYDYLYRDNKLVGISLYKFVSDYKKVRIFTKRNTDQEQTESKLKFNNNHHQHVTHELVKRQKKCIPILILPTIPRANDTENQELYSKIIGLLFIPFNNLDELLNINWTTKLRSYLALHKDSEIQNYIENIECLKKSISDAENEKIFLKNKNNDSVIDPSIENSHINSTCWSEEHEFFEADDEQIETTSLYDNQQDGKDIRELEWHNNAISCLEKIFRIESKTSTNRFFNDAIDYNTFLIKYDKQQEMNLKSWKQTIKDYNKIIVQSQMQIDEPIQQVDNYKIPDTNEIVNNEQSTTHLEALESVCIEFNLNDKQQIAIKYFLAKTINASIQQRRIYVGGEGGTGKSRIIAAVKKYFQVINKTEELFVSAPTGSSAKVIDGLTIHHLARLSRKQNQIIKNSLRTTQMLDSNVSNNFRSMQTQWKSCNYLIIDEISMIGPQMLNKININLQAAKNNELEPFGGITVLFLGDFMQHPPVNQGNLYTRCRLEKDNITSLLSTTVQNETIAGRLLWIQLTHVVFLTEQMRQAEDVMYAKLLSRMRNGQQTEETLNNDYKLLSTRVIDKMDVVDSSWDSVGVCVSRNSLREQINNLYINRYQLKNNSKCIQIQSIDTRVDNKTSIKLSSILQQETSLLDESKTGRLMNILPLIQEIEYIITHNVCVRKGIVNGARVKLKAICSEDITLFENDFLNNMTSLPTIMPKFLLVELQTENNEPNAFINLDNRLIPLEPVEETFPVKIGTQVVKIKRKQFPLTPSFAFTSYKAQGATLDKLIVDLSYPFNKKKHDFAYVYVALSRVKNLKDLLILRDFPKEVLRTRIPEDLIIEWDRLKKIEQKTISNFSKYLYND